MDEHGSFPNKNLLLQEFTYLCVGVFGGGGGGGGARNVY